MSFASTTRCTWRPGFQAVAIISVLSAAVPVDAQNEAGATALVLAAQAGDKDAVRALLDAGADPNATGEDHVATPFTTADLPTLQLLLDEGADPKATTGAGATLLHHLAAQEPGPDEVPMLLALIERIEKAGVSRTAKDKDGDPPLVYGATLEAVQAVAAEGQSVAKWRSENGRTVLHFLAGRADERLVPWLLSRGADPKAHDKNGNTALIQAAAYGRTKAVRALLDAGADVAARNEAKQDALFFATKNEHAETARVLVQAGADARAKTKDEKSLLLRAVASGDAGWVKTVLASAPGAIQEKTLPQWFAAADGHGALFAILSAHRPLRDGERGELDELAQALAQSCARRASIEGLQFLLEQGYSPTQLDEPRGELAERLLNGWRADRLVELVKIGFSVPKDTPNLDEALARMRGDTPAAVPTLLQLGATERGSPFTGQNGLHLAASRGASRVLEALVAAGFEIDRRDEEARTALGLAIRNRHMDAAFTLLRLGAKPEHVGFKAFVSGDQVELATALLSRGARLGSKGGGLGAATSAITGDAFRLLALLESRGVDLKQKPSGGGTLAKHATSVRMLRHLAKRGVDLRTPDDMGQAPIHVNVSARRKQVVRYLAEAGVDLNARDAFGNAPLHAAAHKGDAELIAALLDAGASLATRNHQGRTALHLAAQQGQADAVQRMLARSAAVDARDEYGDPPLSYALVARDRGKDEPTWKLLLDAGADIKLVDGGATAVLRWIAASKACTIDVIDRLLGQGAEPLLASSLWRDLAQRVDLAPLKHLWRKQRPPDTLVRWLALSLPARGIVALADRRFRLDDPPFRRDSALHKLAEAKAFDAEAAAKLVALGVPLQHGGQRGRTALHDAAYHGRIQAITWLLDNGASIDAFDDDGVTALGRAVDGNEPEAAKLLLQRGADPDIRSRVGRSTFSMAGPRMADILGERITPKMKPDTSGNTALHHAARMGHVASVKRLLARGADPSARNAKGETPLHLGVHSAEVTRALVAKGVDLNVVDEGGRTALHLAAGKAHPGSVRALLDAGADAKLDDRSGRDPLFACVDSWGKKPERAAITKMLLRRGVSATRKRRKITPLHEALDGELLEVAKLLLDAGASVHTPNDDGDLPIHEAARESGELTQLILERGGRVDARNDKGQTPLHVAGSEHAVRLLLEKGANVNAVDAKGVAVVNRSWSDDSLRRLLDAGANVQTADKDGRTPLHRQADYGDYHLDELRMLLAKGASPNVPDKQGRTPLDVAADESETKAFRLLLAHGARPERGKDGGRFLLRHVASVGALDVGRRLASSLPPPKNSEDDTLAVLASASCEAIVFRLLERGWRAPYLGPAASKGRVRMLERLLARGGSLSKRDAKGNSVTTAAIGQPLVLHFLLDKGAPRDGLLFHALASHGNLSGLTSAELLRKANVSLLSKDDRGRTPLHLYAYRDALPLAEFFLEHAGSAINATNKRGETALFVAIDGSEEGVAALLLDRNASLTSPKDDPLVHEAGMFYGSAGPHILAKLIKRGADPKQRDKRGRTALHRAIDYGREALVQALLDAGVDEDAKDKNGWTPLHEAADENKLVIVRMLVERGAYLNPKVTAGSDKGTTPLDHAKKGSPLARYLASKGGRTTK